MSSPDIFIFAGEQSGDLHGENLIRSLLEKDAHLKIIGVGGPRMRSIKEFNCIFPMEKFHVMGFIDVLIALPKLICNFYFIKNAILKADPKTIVFIDYPDFNLRMAKQLKKSGFKGKICHYICPSIWAWRKNRIFLMEKVLDTLFCILPFEKSYFKHSSLQVNYVGHPLIKRLEEHLPSPLTFPEGKKLIAIFPGSRKKEILLNFPMQMQLIQKLAKEFSDLHFVISIAHSRFLSQIKEILAESALLESGRISFIQQEQNYDLMRMAHLAIAKSGTVTLELALHKIPTVIIYGIAPLDLFIARNLLKIKLPFYGLPNIIYQKELFPELFGTNLTKQKLYTLAKNFLLNENARNECQEKCKELYTLLKNRDADGDIAEALITHVNTIQNLS